MLPSTTKAELKIQTVAALANFQANLHDMTDRQLRFRFMHSCMRLIEEWETARQDGGKSESFSNEWAGVGIAKGETERRLKEGWP